MEWAAIHMGDGDKKIPIGNACDKCHRVACDILQYNSWADFCQTFADNAALKDKALQLRDNLETPGTHSGYDQERVGQTIGTCLRIDRKVPGVSNRLHPSCFAFELLCLDCL